MFESKPSKKSTKPPGTIIGSYTQIFLCYFDEVRGHIPLASYPDKNLLFDEVATKPIFVHSVWFLSVEEQEDFDHIDLDYSDRTYLAKKFRVPTTRKKERAGCEADETETMVLIVSVPSDLSVIGSHVLANVYEGIKENLTADLHKIVKGDIARAKPIKTIQVQQVIKEADVVLDRLYKICEWILAPSTTSILNKLSDSVTKQKALAYLMLVDGSPQAAKNGGVNGFFTQKPTSTPSMVPNITVNNINFCRDKECIEVILENHMSDDIVGAKITVSNVQGFFEKHFFEHEVEYWFAQEEIMLKFPFIKNMREYIITVEVNGKKYLNKRLEVSEIISEQNGEK